MYKHTTAILVFNDGETWGQLEGSMIAFVTADGLECLNEGGELGTDVKPVAEFGLSAVPVSYLERGTP